MTQCTKAVVGYSYLGFGLRAGNKSDGCQVLGQFAILNDRIFILGG